MQYFCPNCFEKVAPNTQTCPSCGVDIPSFGKDMTYEARLIHALHHPIDETRMGAIIALGQRHTVHAAVPLADLAFRWPKDVWQALEIIRALHKMPIVAEVESALIRLATEHPARPVRTTADHVREEMFVHGTRHPPIVHQPAA
ncbi:MAG: zinc ribbon domain-containing protein [Pseudomonadota bacterium]